MISLAAPKIIRYQPVKSCVVKNELHTWLSLPINVITRSYPRKMRLNHRHQKNARLHLSWYLKYELFRYFQGEILKTEVFLLYASILLDIRSLSSLIIQIIIHARKVNDRFIEVIVDVNGALLPFLDHLTVQARCSLRANHFHRLTRRIVFLSI